MAWRTIGSHQYYQQTYRDVDGRVRTRYFGRGPLAEVASRLHEHRRARRIEVRLEIRELTEAKRRLVEIARQRIIQVGDVVDRAMVAAGFHKHHGSWRRNGKITMRTLREHANDSSIEIALRREAASRHFLSLDGDE